MPDSGQSFLKKYCILFVLKMAFNVEWKLSFSIIDLLFCQKYSSILFLFHIFSFLSKFSNLEQNYFEVKVLIKKMLFSSVFSVFLEIILSRTATNIQNEQHLQLI